MSICLWCRDSNPKPLEHEPSPATTKPVLLLITLPMIFVVKIVVPELFGWVLNPCHCMLDLHPSSGLFVLSYSYLHMP